MDNSLKDKVLEAVDIVEVIGERVSLSRRGKEYVGLCPFHDDHRPSLSVSPSKQIFKCWSCGAGGDAIKFVQLYERVEFREALATLARRAGIDVRMPGADPQASAVRERIRKALNWARSHFQRNLRGPAGAAARAYARGRGLSEQTVTRFGLGLAKDSWDDLLRAAGRAGIAPNTAQQAGLVTTNETGKTYDRFRNRLIFPICDALGRVVAFGGRTLGDDDAKYLNSPETALFSKSRVLYGLDQARRAIEAQSEAIIVEGYTDAILLHQHGFENVVATLGTALTEAHVKLLRPFAGSLVLCFDSDKAGMQAADRAVATALRGRIDVRVLIMGTGQDPADCVTNEGATGFESVLHSAVDALEFKWSQTVAGLEESDSRGRRIALEEFIQFVAGASLAGGLDPLAEGLLVGRLSELLSLPPRSIYELLATAKTTASRRPTTAPETLAVPAYEASIRGLPPGMVAAAEELFGLVLTDATLWAGVDEVLAAAVARCETWGRLHAIFGQLREDCGVFTRGDVLGRCEDSALCELISRACERVDAGLPTGEACRAARERLISEFDVLQMGHLRGCLSRQDAAGESGREAFESLLEVARRQHGGSPQTPLAADRRWNTQTAGRA
jgi:DNA primase